MKAKVLHWLTLSLGIISGVLAIADKIHALPFIPGWLAQYWGVGISIALTIRSIIPLLGDLLDDGQLNNSFRGDPPAPEPPKG